MIQMPRLPWWPGCWRPLMLRAPEQSLLGVPWCSPTGWLCCSHMALPHVFLRPNFPLPVGTEVP